VPVSGDFGALAKIQGQIAHLPTEGKIRVIRACAQEGRLLVEEGFEAGKAPSGAPWAPVRRGGQPLRDTGRLLASLTPKVSAAGFAIESTVAYAGVHQYGATVTAKKGRSLGTPKAGWFGVKVVIPARPFLPDGNALPGPWETRLTEAAEDALDAFFR